MWEIRGMERPSAGAVVSGGAWEVREVSDVGRSERSLLAVRTREGVHELGCLVGCGEGWGGACWRAGEWW